MPIRRPGLCVAAVLSGVGALFLASLAHALTPGQRDAAAVTAGVYTPEQAARGESIYTQQCADCHQRDLSGGDRGPALAGDSFLDLWIGLSVGDLFARIRTSMPVDSPGSLTPDATAEIVAFLLQANDYPAGRAMLPSDPAVLKGITITRHKQALEVRW